MGIFVLVANTLTLAGPALNLFIVWLPRFTLHLGPISLVPGHEWSVNCGRLRLQSLSVGTRPRHGQALGLRDFPRPPLH